MMNDFVFKRRFVFVLTCENHKIWFRQMQRWLIVEELWEIVNLNNLSFSVNTSVSTTSDSSDIFTVSDFDNTRLNAKTQYWISICINEDDQEHTANLSTFKRIWESLQNKYKEKLQTTERQYLTDFMNYKKSSNKIIEKTWTKLSKLTRKIAHTQSNMKDLFTLERRLQTLLQSLLIEYDVIRDVIDAQNNSDHERAI